MSKKELRPLEDLGLFPESTLSIADAVEFVPQKKYALQRWTHLFLIPTVVDGSRRRLHKWTIIGLREGKIIPPRVPRGRVDLDVELPTKRRRATREEATRRREPYRGNPHGLTNSETLELSDRLAGGEDLESVLEDIRERP